MIMREKEQVISPTGLNALTEGLRWFLMHLLLVDGRNPAPPDMLYETL